MPAATTWERTKTGGKKGFDKAYALVDKLGAPVNRLSNKLGAEAFWPTTLDKESDKAARILRSFCKDGFYQEEELPTEEGPKKKQRVVKKIPSEVIANAKGLAIFTTMRSGLWVSGAGGSGVLVARKEDGTWSPPSGIMLHTAGLGFLVGVDIYDCVVVINNQAGLDAFSKVRCTLGGEISAVAGPVGAGGVLESEVHKRQSPIFTYLKSRGFYAGVQIDGTVIIERTDENERFYGERIGVGDILKGKVRHAPFETKMLLETIKAAQGDKNVDEAMLPQDPAPGDVEIEKEDRVFGIPDADDPDPFGVLALENAGMEIREAGSKSRPSSEQFEYRPSPTSPTFNTFHRRSMRSIGSRDSHRGSIDRGVFMEDKGVQTDDLPDPPSKPVVKEPGKARVENMLSPSIMEEGQPKQTASSGIAMTLQLDGQDSTLSVVSDMLAPSTATERSEKGSRGIEADTESDYSERPQDEDNEAIFDDDDIESHHSDADEVKTVSFGAVQQPVQVITNAKVVAIPRRVPPKLPPRNPNRQVPSISTGADEAHESSAAHVDAGNSAGTITNGNLPTESQLSPTKTLTAYATPVSTPPANAVRQLPDFQGEDVLKQESKQMIKESTLESSITTDIENGLSRRTLDGHIVKETPITDDTAPKSRE